MGKSTAPTWRAARVLAVAWLLLSGRGHPLRAQDGADRPRGYRPARHSVALGLVRVEEDGESSWRGGIYWYASERFVPGLTVGGVVAHRTGIDNGNIEPELRWFPLTRSTPLFFSASVICKNRDCARLGGSLAAGAEWYPNRAMGLSASLGWESVYARTSLRDGPYWFTIHVGAALVVPFMTSR